MIAIVAASENQQIARPLKVLASLIRADLSQASQAEKAAGAPYYISIGEKLKEAKQQFTVSSEFKSWVGKNCRFGQRQADLYISLANAELTPEQRIALQTEEKRSLRETIQELTGNKNYGKTAAWKDDAKENIRKAKEDAARWEQEALSRTQERDAGRKLAMQLIDIGFKALASKLHPDKGGTKDAMARLNRVRKHLQQHA